MSRGNSSEDVVSAFLPALYQPFYQRGEVAEDGANDAPSRSREAVSDLSSKLGSQTNYLNSLGLACQASSGAKLSPGVAERTHPALWMRGSRQKAVWCVDILGDYRNRLQGAAHRHSRNASNRTCKALERQGYSELRQSRQVGGAIALHNLQQPRPQTPPPKTLAWNQ
jgi:hypothetical protein